MSAGSPEPIRPNVVDPPEDNVPLCSTAVARNIAEHGRLAADALLRVVAGEHVEDLRSPDPVLTPRGTTALAPRG